MNKRLIDLKEERNLMNKDVAKYLGVGESVYSEWEHNKLSIPTKRLYQLAEFYEVNIDYITGLTDNRLRIKTNKDIDLKIVSARLKEIRRNLKMTMRDLAEKFNTSSSAISNYENNKFLILSPFLIELCKTSNYSIDWVLGRSEEKKLN